MFDGYTSSFYLVPDSHSGLLSLSLSLSPPPFFFWGRGGGGGGRVNIF